MWPTSDKSNPIHNPVKTLNLPRQKYNLNPLETISDEVDIIK